MDLEESFAEANRRASPGFPQGLENRENREKNNGQGKVREKSGNFILGQKSGKSQGILF